MPTSQVKVGYLDVPWAVYVVDYLPFLPWHQHLGSYILYMDGKGRKEPQSFSSQAPPTCSCHQLRVLPYRPIPDSIKPNHGSSSHQWLPYLPVSKFMHVIINPLTKLRILPYTLNESIGGVAPQRPGGPADVKHDEAQQHRGLGDDGAPKRKPSVQPHSFSRKGIPPPTKSRLDASVRFRAETAACFPTLSSGVGRGHCSVNPAGCIKPSSPPQSEGEVPFPGVWIPGTTSRATAQRRSTHCSYGLAANPASYHLYASDRIVRATLAIGNSQSYVIRTASWFMQAREQRRSRQLPSKTETPTISGRRQRRCGDSVKKLSRIAPYHPPLVSVCLFAGRLPNSSSKLLGHVFADLYATVGGEANTEAQAAPALSPLSPSNHEGFRIFSAPCLWSQNSFPVGVFAPLQDLAPGSKGGFRPNPVLVSLTRLMSCSRVVKLSLVDNIAEGFWAVAAATLDLAMNPSSSSICCQNRAMYENPIELPLPGWRSPDMSIQMWDDASVEEALRLPCATSLENPPPSKAKSLLAPAWREFGIVPCNVPEGQASQLRAARLDYLEWYWMNKGIRSQAIGK
ncbi:hypothetical protein BGZ63DRAFT_407930 [Mariannaea sp. PMI_226]|nr:hypothetical protein BGZ63DRAFT_407930 [Mariannaea sp. PMI_226]